MKRPSPDVDGIGDDRHPILHRVGRDAADQSANQYNQRHAVLVKANRFGKPLDRERTVSLDFLVSRFVRLMRGIEQFLRRIELGHQSMDGSIVRRN